MCGRFTLTTKDFDAMAAQLGASVLREDVARYRPRYNIAPTDEHWILRTKQEERQLLPAKWGLVNSWATDAKAEHLHRVSAGRAGDAEAQYRRVVAVGDERFGVLHQEGGVTAEQAIGAGQLPRPGDDESGWPIPRGSEMERRQHQAGGPFVGRSRRGRRAPPETRRERGGHDQDRGQANAASSPMHRLRIA